MHTIIDLYLYLMGAVVVGNEMVSSDPKPHSSGDYFLCLIVAAFWPLVIPILFGALLAERLRERRS